MEIYRCHINKIIFRGYLDWYNVTKENFARQTMAQTSSGAAVIAFCEFR